MVVMVTPVPVAVAPLESVTEFAVSPVMLVLGGMPGPFTNSPTNRPVVFAMLLTTLLVLVVLPLKLAGVAAPTPKTPS